MIQEGLFRPDALHPVKSNWTPPTEFPDLSSAKTICIDLETHDENIKEKGPGTRRGSYIAGVAVGTDDGYRGYFPIAHDLGGNLDRGIVLRWLKEELSRTNQKKIGANILYDLEFLKFAGVDVKGKIYDVQYAEPLIDENQNSYSLDTLARKYLGETKVTSDLYSWIERAYGRGNPGSNIWRAPVSLVGPYAEGDVDLPLRIFELQKPELEKQDLWDLFEIECGNIPLLLAMRERGVRVDVNKTERLLHQLEAEIRNLQKQLNSIAGIQINVDAAASIAKLFDKLGISYPRTAKTGAPSFVKGWLEGLSNVPAVELILKIRKYQTIVGTFLKGYILDMNIDGRLYGLFHPLRSDEGGTVSGRFSSSLPNLQNIPVRDKTPIAVDDVVMRLGKAIRSLFIPEEDCTWVKDDYSQVEFRILTHFGRGDSAEEARSRYCTDPTTDFHDMVADMCKIERDPAKNINFGLAYSMGESKLARSLGKSLEEARALFQQYHERLPFVKDLQTWVSQTASTRGYIRTILKRRARFDLWEPRYWDDAEGATPLEYKIAASRWGENKIRRAYTHKALNRLIQGSAADVMKKAMYNIGKSGVIDVLGSPHLTVHDELDWSVPQTKIAQEAHKEVLNIMENAVKFQIPIVCDSESGPNWGEVK